MTDNNQTETKTDLTGPPDWLMRLNEYFVEEMPHPQSQHVTRDILAAIQHGKDISIVENSFLLWLLTDEEHGSIKYCDEAGKKTTLDVAALHQRVIDGGNPRESEWGAARAAAWTAIWYKARPAARHAARAPARAEARHAAWAAAWAAAGDPICVPIWDVTEAAARNEDMDTARDAARDAAMTVQAAKLIELLKDVPIYSDVGGREGL